MDSKARVAVGREVKDGQSESRQAERVAVIKGVSTMIDRGVGIADRGPQNFNNFKIMP